MNTKRLEIKNVCVKIGGLFALRDVSFEIDDNQLLGFIGPNGAGKTTLLKAALGLIEHSGDSSLAALPLNERSSTAAWMPQEREINWPISVLETVALGQLLPTKNLDKNEIINDAKNYLTFEKDKTELEKILNDQNSDKELLKMAIF